MKYEQGIAKMEGHVDRLENTNDRERVMLWADLVKTGKLVCWSFILSNNLQTRVLVNTSQILDPVTLPPPHPLETYPACLLRK